MPDIRVTIVSATGAESHLELPKDTVRALLAVPTPQQFIEVPPEAGQGSMWKEYLHSSQIARLLVHDSIE
jgi:hypothetical protein